MDGSILTASGLSVRDTGTLRGRGVFAERDFAAGDIVTECPVLEVRACFSDLPKDIQHVVYDWGFLTKEDGAHDTFCIALGVGSLFNHSEKSNILFEANKDKQSLIFKAKHFISAGAELLINYNDDTAPGVSEWFELTGITPLSTS